MSNRYQGGFIRPGYNPLRVPNAPTIGTATDSKTDGTVTVAFTAPSCVGGGAITGYTAVANCGAKFASGSSSPITVTGLTNCTAYTFRVYANNAFGPSAYSAASNSVTPTKIVVGQQAYTTAGTYSWVAPAGVTSVSVVAVGGGASFGGGGGLGYKNNYAVTPGSSYSVVVGSGGAGSNVGIGCNGKDSYFVSTCVVKGGGGKTCSPWKGTYTGDGGGNGGCNRMGGAGGYSGNGGAGNTSGNAGTAGAGGGGGGGGSAASNPYYYAAGGGVGILGQGANGAGGVGGGPNANSGGRGGSGGCNGTGAQDSPRAKGGAYGGGGGALSGYTCCGSSFQLSGAGGGGAVRIIWPGNTRKFPSTCTGDK